MKDLNQVAKKLTSLVNKYQPKSIDEKWIKKHSKSSYEFVKINNISWDSVTRLLDKSIQRKWNKGHKEKN